MGRRSASAGDASWSVGGGDPGRWWAPGRDGRDAVEGALPAVQKEGAHRKEARDDEDPRTASAGRLGNEVAVPESVQHFLMKSEEVVRGEGDPACGVDPALRGLQQQHRQVGGELRCQTGEFHDRTEIVVRTAEVSVGGLRTVGQAVQFPGGSDRALHRRIRRVAHGAPDRVEQQVGGIEVAVQAIE